MTNLNTATPRLFRDPLLAMPHTVYAAGGALFEGSALQFNASDGDLENMTGTGTTFAGFANESCTADQDRIDVIEEGVVRLTVAKGSNFALTDRGAIVYATDGNTFTLVSTSAQKVGRIVDIESGVGSNSAVCWVAFRGVQRKDA